MTRFSVLDLAPIVEGGSPADAFRNTLDLARQAEALGYHRYWMAEHHGMPGIASAATAVVIAHVAVGTSTIRVGAGGIMLPNHAPLVIAEQFGTLESLYPGRIDLGLGRAPGSDPLTARALRRNLAASADDFPHDVLELMDYLSAAPRQQVMAVPGKGLQVPIWILGSSLYGAQLAAALGLPYAFASHFAPQQMMAAIQLYRSTFQPSAQLARPYVMLGYNVFAADSDAEAEVLASSAQQAVVRLRTGHPGQLPPPMPGYLEQAGPEAQAIVRQALACSAIGGPDTVRVALRAFIERTGADELMINANIHDHAARVNSFRIAAQATAELDAFRTTPS